MAESVPVTLCVNGSCEVKTGTLGLIFGKEGVGVAVGGVTVKHKGVERRLTKTAPDVLGVCERGFVTKAVIVGVLLGKAGVGVVVGGVKAAVSCEEEGRLADDVPPVTALGRGASFDGVVGFG